MYPQQKIVDGRKIAIMGMCRKGIAAAQLAEHFGGSPFISDQADDSRLEPYLAQVKKNGWAYEVGGHSDRILECDLIVRCSAVPASLPILQGASIPVLDEVDFAGAFISVPILAVTGTNGKTSTIRMLAEMARYNGIRMLNAGGTDLHMSEAALRLVQAHVDYDLVSLEVSAIQLDSPMMFLHPVIGCLTQITEDHLKRFETMDRYVEAKKNLFIRQAKQDIFVTNYDCLYCREIGKKFPGETIWVSAEPNGSGIWVDGGHIWRSTNSKKEKIIPLSEIPIPKHHVPSALLACGLASVLKISREGIIHALKSFPGVPHRYERAGITNGIKIINDSKATNAAATIAAIIETKGPMVLLAGGICECPLEELASVIRAHPVLALVGYGPGGDAIIESLNGAGIDSVFCESFDSAVEKALFMAQEKQVEYLLFSPAGKTCTADGFRNAEDRGKRFKEIVNR